VQTAQRKAPYHGLLTHQRHQRAAVLTFDVVKVGHGGLDLMCLNGSGAVCAHDTIDPTLYSVQFNAP
jgi:hypothetical protein